MRKKTLTTLYLVIAGIVLLNGCKKENKRETITTAPEHTPVVSFLPTEDKLKASFNVNTLVSSLSLKEKAGQITGSLETLLPDNKGYTYIEETLTPSVIFPSNMALGVVNDTRAMYEMGLYIGNENRKANGKISFAKVATVSTSPLWSRTYQSFSEEYERVYQLGKAYVQGLAASKVMPCLCDFIGTGYGFDEDAVTLSEEEIRKQLYLYRRLLDAIYETDSSLPVAIQVSSVTVNGTKMIENKELLTDMLKGVMEFDGVVMGQASEIEELEKGSLKEKVASALLAGIDCIYATDTPNKYQDAIVEAVESGLLPEDRVNEAVTRILTVKKKLGLFDDSKKTDHIESAMSKEEAEELAASLVERSLVLLQNNHEVLPFKKGQRIFVTGLAAENASLYKGIMEVAKDYKYDIITDKTKAKDADVTLLCLGEKNNTASITEAKELGLKTIALLVTGSQPDISTYRDQWDAIVMCYLPGSRGDRIAHVLAGEIAFTGKLAISWYDSEEKFTPEHVLYGRGYGREY